jgi:hypothetical protein
MFLIISFRKSFRNVMVFPFLELFGEKHKFETCFGKFEDILFDFFNVINQSRYNLIMKFQSLGL